MRKLPGWAVDNAESVRREAEPYLDMTFEQRFELLRSACEDAMRILATRDDAAAVLAHVDPLPESSVQLLARLREESRR